MNRLQIYKYFGWTLDLRYRFDERFDDFEWRRRSLWLGAFAVNHIINALFG